MSVLDRKLRREILGSKGLIAAIVAIVAVGVCCFVSMFATYRNLDRARVDFYARCRMADFWIDLKKAPADVVDELLGVSGVAEVRGRITFPVVVDLEAVGRPLSGQVLTLPEEREPVLNNVFMDRGSYFTAGQPAEVIVSQKFAEARDVQPGDFIHLIMNGQRKRLYVVGTAIAAEFTYLTPPGALYPDPQNYGVFWIKRRYAEEVFDFEGAVNSVVGRLTPEARPRPRPVLDELARRLDDYGVFTTTPLAEQTSNLALRSEMSGLQMMATTMPIMFLVVAVLVLNVLMSRMAEQQRVIVGTLKALGYGNGTVFLHYLEFGLAVGLLGGVAGCVLGHWLAGGMVVIYRQFFEFPNLVAHLYPGLMGLAMAVALVFGALGTARGVRAILRLSAAEAMRPSPPARGGRILLERVPFVWRHLDFRWQMVLRGIFRNRLRTAIGLVASALGAGLVLTALGMADSLRYMLDFQFDKVLRSDYMLTFREDLDAGAVDEVRRMPGVVYVEPVLDVACTFQAGIHRKKGAITGIVADARLTVPHDDEGRVVPVPPVGLLMTRRLAEELGLRAGDAVTFTPIKGLRQPCRAVVARTVDSTIGLAVFADYTWLNRRLGEARAVTGVRIRAHTTAAEKKAFLRNLKRYPTVESVAVIPEERERMQTEFVAKLDTMTYVLILFAGVIFFGSILNGSLIALAERRREIATFRALGYRPGEVGAIFLRENLLVNLTGAALGLPLGWAMLWGMAHEYQNDLYAMPCVIQPATWVATPVIALVFAIAAHLIVQRAIHRQDWAEAIRLKE